MKYQVGSLSKLFNISPQTLHHYEKLGIITAHRDEVNGYRYYDGYGVQQLGTIKKLRNAGFPLKKSTFVYEGKSAKDIRTEYRNRRNEIETEIETLHRIAKRLEYYEEQIERIWMQQDGMILLHLSGFRRLDLGTIPDAEALPDSFIPVASKWFNSLLYTTSSVRFVFDGDRFLSHSFGIIADEDTFRTHLESDTRGTEVIPAGEFASRVFSYRNSVDSIALQDACKNFLHTSGRKAAGNPFTRLITSFKDAEGNRVNLVELLLPLV